MIHNLKIRQEYLENILKGKKFFEVRYNDRDYQVGDIIQFKQIINCNIEKQFNEKFEIIYVHSGLGMKENYVVLGLKKLFQEIADTKKSEPVCHYCENGVYFGSDDQHWFKAYWGDNPVVKVKCRKIQENL